MDNKQFLKKFALERAHLCSKEMLQNFVDTLWQEEANYFYSCNESLRGIYLCPTNLPRKEDLFPDDTPDMFCEECNIPLSKDETFFCSFCEQVEECPIREEQRCQDCYWVTKVTNKITKESHTGECACYIDPRDWY